MPYPGPGCWPGIGCWPGVGEHTDPGSWYSLLNVYREAEQFHLDDISRLPTSCPNDGTILVSKPDGGLRCPFDGWEPGDSSPEQWN